MGWTVEYADNAKKQLRKLDKAVARRILDFMDDRIGGSEDPRRIGKALKGPLGDFWSYRVGDHRIICEIRDGMLVVLVLQIGNRKEIYR